MFHRHTVLWSSALAIVVTSGCNVVGEIIPTSYVADLEIGADVLSLLDEAGPFAFHGGIRNVPRADDEPRLFTTTMPLVEVCRDDEGALLTRGSALLFVASLREGGSIHVNAERESTGEWQSWADAPNPQVLGQITTTLGGVASPCETGLVMHTFIEPLTDSSDIDAQAWTCGGDVVPEESGPYTHRGPMLSFDGACDHGPFAEVFVGTLESEGAIEEIPPDYNVF